jgi:DNA-binding MarR family transcriptional regulator
MTLDFDPIGEARRNWERHGWPRPDAMVAATSVARAQQILIARVDAALSPFGLTFSRFEALALLFFSRRGALPMGKMGARLQVHPTSVTNTVSRLERDGLVRRTASDGDRRTVLAEITPAGRRVVVDAAAALGEAEFGLAPLGEGELGEVFDALLPYRRGAGDVPDGEAGSAGAGSAGGRARAE